MEFLFTPVFLKMSPIEVLAMATVLLQVWLYGRLSLLGPVLGVTGCVLWIMIGMRAELVGLVLLNVILMVQNVWNYVKWSRNQKLAALSEI